VVVAAGSSCGIVACPGRVGFNPGRITSYGRMELMEVTA
jgi:hypothetical protein